MCGIVGYVGPRDVVSVLLGGLWRLEYRGYDSCGIAVINNGELAIRKVPGRLSELQELLKKEPVTGQIGIGHTRWATHGSPIEENTHPLIDCNEEMALVVNGIIENYLSLKEELESRGHIFHSFTDSEVIIHLIEESLKSSLIEAVRETVHKLKGNYAFAVIYTKEPQNIVCARHDAPLVISVDSNESALASDVSGVISIFNNVIDLPNDTIAQISPGNYSIWDFNGTEIKIQPRHIAFKIKDIEKEQFPHFMLKEIFEQPRILDHIIKERIKDDNIVFSEGFNFTDAELKKVSRIFIQACGTSWHAGIVGKYLLERFARIGTEVDISSEFRYRDTVLDGNTIVMAISQSGETADTIAGIREAKAKFLKVLSLVNALHSSIYKESDAIIPIMAGPEIGVASTKAYTAQILNIYLLSLYLGKLRGFLSGEEINKHLRAIRNLPEQVEEILNRQNEVRQIAAKFFNSRDFIFLGRGLNYPTAIEGALKLKEISYIHATGYAAGEMKHGPIALIDENMPVVCVNPKSSVYEKMFANIKEVTARRGKVISIISENDKATKEISDFSIAIPECLEYLSPILAIIPLQLLAYFIATFKGLDVDRPRNLAKSVTVE